MLLKTVGALLLFGISLYAAMESGQSLRRRMLQGEGMLQLLRHIRTQISCFSTPLPEIYASFENPALSDAGFLRVLRQDGLAAALDACEVCLEESERRMLLSFAEELGNSYRTDQLALCDAYIDELAAVCERKKNELPKKSKLYRSLILTGGLAAVILLL